MMRERERERERERKKGNKGKNIRLSWRARANDIKFLCFTT